MGLVKYFSIQRVVLNEPKLGFLDPPELKVLR